MAARFDMRTSWPLVRAHAADRAAGDIPYERMPARTPEVLNDHVKAESRKAKA